MQMNKVKQASKDKKKTKQQNGVKKQQQLPYYLNDAPPAFSQEKCITGGYFDERQDMLAEDTTKCEELLTNYIQSQKETQQRIQQLRQFTCESGANFDSSLPFYTCKGILFNQYLICLKMYELFRLNSADFTQGPGLRLYQRLVYLKTLILKLTPVENKLQYQKNKLLKKGEKIRVKQFNKRATNQNEEDNQNQNEEGSEQQQDQEHNGENGEPLEQQDEEDNLAYKPMVKNLIANQTKKESQKQGKYVAPRQSAVLPAEEKIKRRQERQQQRRKAHLLRKFRGDIESGDEAEEKHMLQGIDERFKKRYEQKLRFEEQNFTRLNETKKQKYWKKQMMKNRFNNSLNNELKQIQMIRELVDDETGQAKRPNPIPIKSKKSAPKEGQKRRKID